MKMDDSFQPHWFPLALGAPALVSPLARTASTDRRTEGGSGDVPARQATARPRGPDLLRRAIAACATASAPSRRLDATIGRAVFPGLALLEELEPGIWRRGDGGRVRALNYSRSWTAATTLVPTGCWIEHDCAEVIVVGARGGSRGSHDFLHIALCIAALRARLLAAPDAAAEPQPSQEN